MQMLGIRAVIKKDGRIEKNTSKINKNQKRLNYGIFRVAQNT